jgi:murein DD-endopeptidase MepM/ murein hydrolase activator NlpD
MASPEESTAVPYTAAGGDIGELLDKNLLVPVAGIEASSLRSTFRDSRSGGRVHEAMDILAPRGTPVVAAVDGRLVKLFTSALGGLTIYQFDREERFCYYYAHLDSYAPNLSEGQELKRGQVIGTVGTTGNAPPGAPHLHFAIFKLGADKKWWDGVAVDPALVLK